MAGLFKRFYRALEGLEMTVAAIVLLMAIAAGVYWSYQQSAKFDPWLFYVASGLVVAVLAYSSFECLAGRTSVPRVLGNVFTAALISFFTAAVIGSYLASR